MLGFFETKEGRGYKGIKKENMVATIEAFTHVVFQIFEVLPDGWTEEIVAYMFKEGIAKCVTMPLEIVPTIPDDLCAFVTFLKEGNVLRAKHASEIVAAIKTYTKDLITSSNDKSIWNTAKLIGRLNKRGPTEHRGKAGGEK